MRRTDIDTRTLVLAGLAGGMAEVAWVAGYSAVSPLAGSTVLREITNSLFPAWAASPMAPALGMLIHFTLAVAVALAFGLAVSRSYAATRSRTALMTVSLLALAGIWTFNFFVLLPVLNPVFVALMPYPVTLASKLLFGVAMGATLMLRPVPLASRREAVAARA